MSIQPLERELLSLLGGDDKARVAARYCGFDGRGGTTLQTAGAEFGITAERVRQIVGEVMKSRNSRSLPAPTLSRTISFIAQRSPGFAEDIEGKLQSAGLTTCPFRVEGVIRAAELFGKPVPFLVTETQRARLVHSFSPESLEAVVKVAHRAVEQAGVASLDHVCAEVRKVAPEAADIRLISDVLTSTDDCRWLGHSSEWFWLPSVLRNPLARRIRKILSIVNPVPAGVLYEAVIRDARLASYAPPPAVLIELCRQLPGIRTDGDTIEADPAIPPAEVLGELEIAMVAIMAAHGGVMRRSELAALCLKQGVNRASFYSSLSHSPVIVIHPAGWLGLIGREVDPKANPNRVTPRPKYLRSKSRAHTIRLRKWIK